MCLCDQTPHPWLVTIPTFLSRHTQSQSVLSVPISHYFSISVGLCASACNQISVAGLKMCLGPLHVSLWPRGSAAPLWIAVTVWRISIPTLIHSYSHRKTTNLLDWQTAEAKSFHFKGKCCSFCPPYATEPFLEGLHDMLPLGTGTGFPHGATGINMSAGEQRLMHLNQHRWRNNFGRNV